MEITMSKNKHLSFEDRCAISKGLTDRRSFKAIAVELGKDCTCISKEVRNHRQFTFKCSSGRTFNDCANRSTCTQEKELCEICDNKHRRTCSFCVKCGKKCPDYKQERCPSLEKPPYVCNGCKNRYRCTLEKCFYNAREAYQEYRERLSESRSGVNLTEDECAKLDAVISPLLRKGQSLHHILQNNRDDVMICEKTAYLYVDMGIFSARNIDMVRKVRFRPRRNKSVGIKIDRTCRIGRSYQDFLAYREANPSLPVVELDSVIGITGGSVLLTVHFVRAKLQLAFLRESNNARSVTEIFRSLYETLGVALYRKLFPIFLTDNGSEFSDPTALEKMQDGKEVSKVFYCNPSAPGQKGSCEVNHEFIRRVIHKGTDIGRFSQEQINLMMDNINSYSRPELENKTPYEMFTFYYGEEALEKLGVHRIPANEITLTPDLMK